MFLCLNKPVNRIPKDSKTLLQQTSFHRDLHAAFFSIPAACNSHKTRLMKWCCRRILASKSCNVRLQNYVMCASKGTLHYLEGAHYIMLILVFNKQVSSVKQANIDSFPSVLFRKNIC